MGSGQGFVYILYYYPELLLERLLRGDVYPTQLYAGSSFFTHYRCIASVTELLCSQVYLCMQILLYGG